MYEETNTSCTKHAMYLQSNIEALSSNHCCSGAGGGWGEEEIHILIMCL